MALSYAVYPADGTTTQFDLTFGYLRKSHVFVFVDGELVGFKWVSPTRVELITVPDPEQFVRIQRLTDRSSRITDFTDGQTLLAGDLNAGDLQNFYILQELLDQIVDGVLTGAVPVLDNGSGYITEQWISEQLNGSLEQSAALTELSNRIIAEEITRAQAVAAEAQQRLDGLATEAVARADAVLAEANARAAALSIVASDLANEVSTRASQVAALGTDLTNEVSTRASQVAALVSDLTDEVNTRTSQVTALGSDLTDEVTTRTSQVAALGSDLVDETTARVLGDDTLNAAIVAESAARQSDSTAFASTLTGIVTRQDATDAAVLTETTARSTADDALSQLLTILTTRVGDAEADIVSEQQARTTADTAIASDVTLLTTRVGDAEADILSEQTARTDADAAIATDVSGLVTRMGAAEAGIVSEQQARTTADTAIASDLTALTTRMGAAEANIVSEQTVRIDADNVLAASVTALTSQVDDNAAAIVSESATRVNADNVLATSLNALTTRVGASETLIASEQTARADADSAIATDLTALTTRVGDAEADIISEQQARTTADTAIASDVTLLTTRMGDAEADILSEQTARADADTAITTNVSGLLTRMGDAEADIVSEQTARSTADTAIASDVTALTTRVGDTEADIISDRQARVDGDVAIAADVTLLTTRMGDAEADIISEQQARTSADTAIATDVSGLLTRVGDAEADIVSEQTARSTADGALTTSLNALTTRVGTTEADIIQNASAILDEESARVSLGNQLSLVREGLNAFGDPYLLDSIDSFNISAIGTTTLVSDPKYKGGKALRTRTNAIANHSSTFTLPISADKKYRFETGFWLEEKPTAGETIVYMGIQCLDADGNTVGPNVGRLYTIDHTYVISTFAEGQYISAIKTVGAGGDIALHADTVAVRLIMYTGYGGSGEYITVDFDHFEITDITDVDNLDARITEEAFISSQARSVNAGRIEAIEVSIGDESDGTSISARIASAEQAIIDNDEARVEDIRLANVATETAQADATSALQLVATEESSRLSEVSRLDAQFKRGETSINLVRNGHFTYDPVGTVGLPSGWEHWANGNACIINQDLGNPDRAVLHMDAKSDFPNFGIRQWVQNITPGATYVVTARVRRLDGTFTTAGVHLQWRNASGGNLGTTNHAFAVDGNLEGADALTPDGVVTYSKTVTAHAGATQLLVYLMGAWTGFGTNAGCQIDWLEVSVKAADAVTNTALNAQATADAATVAVATESGARVTQTNALSGRIDTTEADILTNAQAVVTERLARIGAIETATAATEQAQADATSALQLVSDETTARSTAFNSLDARVVSSLSNDADFIKNPSAAYGTAVGYSGNRTGRNVGVTITTDSGVPSGDAFSRAGTDTYVHKPGYGVGANDLGWYKEGGWGGTSIRIRGWFKSPSSTMVSQVGVHLCDINFLNPAWPRVDVSTATETDWVWFDDVYLISTSYTQEFLMPFIRCTGPDTPLVLFEQLSWVDVSTVEELSATVSTQAASIASAQQAIADESTARSSALDTVNARFESNVNHRNIHPMPLFDEDWATVYTAGWNGNHGLPVSRGVNLDSNGAWGGKGGFDVHYTKITGTPANGTVVHDVGMRDDYLIPVVAGGVYFFSVFAAEHRLNQLVLLINRYDTSKTVAGSNIIMNSATGLTKTAANGDEENFVRLWGYFTAPETGFVSVYTRGIATGVDADPFLWTAGYMAARVDTTHDTSKPLPFTASEAAAAKSVAGVKFLKEAFATPNSSTARLLLGVNTANNEAVIEQIAQEGSGVWNGSKIKFTADDFEFNGDVIINGTITADNLAPNAVTSTAVDDPGNVAVGTSWTTIASISFTSVGIGTELRASVQLYAGAVPGGGVGGVGYVRLRRGLTVLREKEALFNMTNTSNDPLFYYYEGSLDFVLDKNDLPAAGTYTYTLQAQMPGNTGTAPTRTAIAPYLSAREFKR